ncbi:hypothetical protein IWQ60_008919 [Tieghemiomyces parasiticus]|uniref:threonine--tRNA ligase n=1 Tax=Tieghemiomyces parasiticus TaxID=78921 RepID=A0A9W7ZWN5_9FUNG|nr:hypothetical protein IWQ60_008919 [Tieghemiomyces parasiticus]
MLRLTLRSARVPRTAGPHVRLLAKRAVPTWHDGTRTLATKSPTETKPASPKARPHRGSTSASDRTSIAAERDHRVIGQAQALFTFHSDVSPGSVFLLPHGTRIAQRIFDTLRAGYRFYGFDEVMTPLIYKKTLWETSGHWQNYADDMFIVTDRVHLDSLTRRAATWERGGQATEDNGSAGGPGLLSATYQSSCCGDATAEALNAIPGGGPDEILGLKPMNCPGHCLLFNERPRSYRELPLRLADFSPLHRNENNGSLSGLTRVRKFHQDDGHIFCRPDQIAEEMAHALTFLDRIYELLAFPDYQLTLSTRPTDKYIGELTEWDQAERALEEALERTGRPWTLKPGDGAFYGPKIDVMVRDALGRAHQTATIQLDFQLPRRFGLSYNGEAPLTDVATTTTTTTASESTTPSATVTKHTPVIIHRAILGSLERMLAILIEHYAGKWPFWLSPRQAKIIPVGGGDKFLPYAQQVQRWLAHPATYQSPPSSALENGPSQEVSSRAADNHTTGAHFDPARLAEHFYIDVEADTQRSLNRMVREAQLAQYNFILVVGEKEATNGTVSVRARDGKQLGTLTIAQCIALFRDLQARHQ